MGDIVRHINGTTGWVRAITYFPNSKLCATANSVNGIQVWDIATGEVKQELGGPALSVRRLMVSPDSKVIALVTKDKLVRIWNLVTGQEMKIFSGKKRWTGSLDSIVTLMTFSNTSETVIASDGNSVLIYDLAEDQMRYLHDFIYPDFIINKDKVYVFRNFVIAAISMSPDEKLIALLSSDSTIWIYHVVTGRGQKLSPRTGAARTSLRFTSNGNS
ncbi:pre-mRNA-splicing factor prp46 [Penicillium subrubescens]|nr:pre-mRNA-splicing factor prp46 [Penicillium subrubescens]KAJ5896606.1 pre-mRNA-splicing factor prp46 [Penicillium subrubescens]